MREHDNLAALIDDADAWADQFCASVPGRGGASDLHAGSPIAAKVRAYRELLYCRFADQAFSAARSARHGAPVSTSSLTRSAFETYTHLFELHDHLEAAFRKGSLDALDGLLTLRLFGDEQNELAAPVEVEAFTLGLYGAPVDAVTLPSSVVPLPIPDNDGADHDELPRVDPGACEKDDRADLALRRLMRTLIAIETSFDTCHRALDEPMRRLDVMFGKG